jgi:hypothetical protein
MKTLMENWRRFSAQTEPELLEDGFKEWALPLLMAAGITAGSPSASAAPRESEVRNTVQRIVVRGGMNQSQKNKLLKMSGVLRMTLRQLNDTHPNNLKDKSPVSRRLDGSFRSTKMRLLGMKPQDWPRDHLVTMQELVDFLKTGKKPVIQPTPPAPAKDSLSDKVGDVAYDIGQGVRKGLDYVDKSPVGLKTGWFDAKNAPER